MILAVDIGNTTVCVCGVEQKKPDGLEARFCTRLSTVHGKSAEEYEAELRQALQEADVSPKEIEGAVVSSVVPCLNEPIHDCVLAVLGREPVWITHRSRTGLIMDVAEPERVGIDRIVDSAWVAANCPLPAVTVDMGTATTFNVIDEGGIFRGGVISVGMATGLRALAAKTAQLPELRLDAAGDVIGKNTVECMRSGSVIGAAAMIDGLVARIEQQLGKPVTLILTGGMARYADPFCTHPHTYDPHLLAKGLMQLYAWNAEPENGKAVRYRPERRRREPVLVGNG